MDVVTEIPHDRWAHGYFLHPVPGTKGKTYTFAAGVIDSLWDFDPEVFRISPREAGQMDPQQRLLLHVVWEALEDAGLPPDRLSGQHVGVYVGCSAMAHSSRLALDAAVTDAYLMTGNTLALVSNRISHALNLRGPSITVDTACSSSIVALRMAEEALLRGEVDMAVVAGVNALLDPNHYVGFSAARMLSPTGRCKPFSAAADGYVRAEGAAAIVLERAEEGRLGPRRAHAVLVGAGTNTDGHTLNVAMPSTEGQADLLRRVYERTGVDPAALAFVEAHGTGTLAGDPVEAAALGQVLGRARVDPLPIGSVKSNIGHLEPASGMAGIMKTLIALEDGIFPASLHASELNPDIPFGDLNLTVANEAVRLKRTGDEPLLAGVSSFGFGGANAHAVFASVDPAAPVVPSGAKLPPVLFLSAASDDALQRMMAEWAPLAASSAGSGDLAELCAQASAFRPQLTQRAAIVADDGLHMADILRRGARGEADPRIVTGRAVHAHSAPVFVFSGNGSQHPGMCKTALKNDPVYARVLRRIDRHLRVRAGWSLLAMLDRADLETQMRDAGVAQPLLFADQIAQVEALSARGLVPAAVMGHSGGEIAAAHAAGILTLDHALDVILRRSEKARLLRGTGTMAAVQASREEVEAAIAAFGQEVELAAENSPRSVTLVGPEEELDTFLRRARRELRWPAVRLAIEYPYHSRAFGRACAPLRTELSALSPRAGSVTFVSSVTGNVEVGSALDADYWVDNASRPVLFRDAMQTLFDIGYRAFLEIGATPVLNAYMAACPGTETVLKGFEAAMPDDVNPVQTVVARAAVHGLRIDLRKIVARPVGQRGDLPTYPWSGRKIRIDGTPTIRARLGLTDPLHPVLGREEGTDANLWYSEADAHVYPVLRDHRVGGRVIMPGTLLADMALAAAQKATGLDRLLLTDIDILAPVVLGSQVMTELQTRFMSDPKRVTISSRPRGESGQHRLNLQAHVHALYSDGGTLRAPDRALRAGDRTGDALYVAARRLGLEYGPAFARVEQARLVSPDCIEVFLRGGAPIGGPGTRSPLDVTGADAALHGVMLALERTRTARLGLAFVPVRIARLALLQVGVDVASARLHLRRVGARSLVLDVELYAADGSAIARMEGVRLHATRVIREVSLEDQAFRQIALPLHDAHPKTGIDPEIVADLCKDMPEDDGYFLIEAVAQAVAARALAKHALQDGNIILPSGGTPYVEAVVAMALRSGAVEETPAGLRLTDVARRADASSLLEILDREHPDKIAEVAALSRLDQSLSDLLDDPGEVATPEAHFGRAVLDNLAEGSVFVRRRLELLVRFALRRIEALAEGDVIRIAEVTDGTARILPALAARFPADRVVLTEIVLPPGSVDDVAILPPGRVRRIGDAMEADPPGGFDMIVGEGLLASATSADDLLQRLEGKLAVAGDLIWIEPEPSDLADLVHGLDAGWWRGGQTPAGPVSGQLTAEDLRRLVRSVPPERAAIAALPEACGAANIVMVRGAVPAERPSPPIDDDLVQALQDGLQSKIDTVTEIVGAARIVAILPAGGAGEDPLQATTRRILWLRDLLARAEAAAARLIVVLPGGGGLSGGLSDPVQSGSWAMLRSAANEHPLLQIVRYDVAAGVSARTAAERIERFEAIPSAETEVLICPRGERVLRAVQGAVSQPVSDRTEEMRSVLRAGPSGGLDGLAWTREPRAAPSDGEVEIAVEAAGLNYRDVMWAMGILPEEALERGLAGPTIGIECAGRVVRCGPGVTHLSVGDSVMAFGPSCLASHVNVPSGQVMKLPDGLSAEAAAAVPVAFFTAWYSLVTLANMRRGETVLIHGGAGGVGLAAVQVARHLGLTIIATAGSETKRAYLRRIGVHHVLDSRSLTFADEVLSLTAGRGVDAVLNSLAGPGMERSLACLAPFGRFLELGKQDFYANSAVGLRALKENIAYFGVDVDQVIAVRRDLSQQVMADVVAAFAQGALHPLPYRTFPPEAAVGAFRLMQKSGHLGKILLQPADPASVIQYDAALGDLPLDPERTHLVVGGLGGLGLELAQWLVDGGARRIALMGRRALPDDAAAQSLERWRQAGVDVQLVACDVSDERALADALEDLRPLASVFHSAMVLEDMPLSQVTPAVLDRVLPAKIVGAAHLDRLTRQDDLDHFVLFTSLATLIGNHGQAAYVAANGHLEAIARKRRAAGLPALAVGWGGIEDVGYLSRDRDRGAMVRRMSGNVGFSGVQAMGALERLLLLGSTVTPVVHVTPMGWSAVAGTLRTLSEPSFSLFQILGRKAAAETVDDDLKATLVGLTQDRAEACLSAWLVTRIARILQVPEKAVIETKPVSELGLDSLMAVELGLSLQEALGEAVPVAAVSDSSSIRQIAARIVRQLHGDPATVETVRGDGMRLASQHLAVAAEAAE